MGLWDALRGGGNKDAMRQTTSLTMAYLLEQNARFEAFMRQKVDDLEAIVAQQQARQVDMGSAGTEAEPDPEDWSSEPEEVTPEPTLAAAEGEIAPAPTAETRPAVPFFGGFTLDDMAPDEETETGEHFGATSAGSETMQQPAATALPPEPEEDGPPPNWQALLLAPEPEPEEPAVEEAVSLTATDLPAADATEAEEPVIIKEETGLTEVELPAADGAEAEESEPEEAVEEETGLTKVDLPAADDAEAEEPEAGEEEGPSLMPAWLRRQQQTRLNIETEAGEQASGESPAAGDDDETIVASEAGEQIPVQPLKADQEPASWGTKSEIEKEPPLTLSVPEDEGEWEVPLEKQGPAGDWE